MQKTLLRAFTTLVDTEEFIALPVNTRRVIVHAQRGQGLIVDFEPGNVDASIPRGYRVGTRYDTGVFMKPDGPLYFASPLRGTTFYVEAFHSASAGAVAPPDLRGYDAGYNEGFG